MEFEIIDFVKANPLLYERKYNNNKGRQLKMEKWHELGALLRRDPNALRLRWRSMRDNYRKQMQLKSKERRDGDNVLGYAYCSKYYNHMTFLNSEYNNDESEADTSQSGLDEVTYEIEPLDIKPAEIEIETFDLNQYFEKHDGKTAGANQSTTSVNAEECQQSKKKRADKKDSIIAEACEEMSALLQNAKQHFVPPSHSQVFFNSVALQVEQAQMPAMDQMRLQQRVLELITQEIVFYQERTHNQQL